MQSQDIDVQFEAGGLTLTLNRAAKVNALSTPMMLRITEAIRQAQADRCTHIVLRSALPRVFCAGADIQEFMLGEEALAKQGDALLEMMHLLATVEIPILAITRGKAAGAGLIMLASADVVIAADNMLWSCPEIEFGMYPTLVHAALAQKLAPARVAQLCVSGLPITAQCALRDGLITDMLAGDAFDQASEARLAYYLARPNALRIARAARLTECDAHALRRHYDHMSHLMHENFSDPTVREAISRYAQALSKSSSSKTQA
ncbi:MAG: enoyl-CoA hydratase/isomerase family protein [Comamonadaceae bacterium]|nr:MAG: enoyl-CoA hydratase/isomerase family protein [Comamonadaceae bacterium]